MRKKIIPIMLMSMLTVSSSVYAFSDVDNHWAKDSIEKLSQINIVKGYEDNTFRPDKNMTRAEVATIINRLIGAQKESLKYIPDLDRQSWYSSEIRKSVQTGVIMGDENGYVRPTSYVTREEVVTMLSRAFYVSGNTRLAKNYIDEEEISKWSKDYFATFVNYKYIMGYEDETIRPKAYITRSEFVTLLGRMFNTIAVGGMHTGKVDGNIIIAGDNVVLNNLTINGNLVIAAGTSKTLTLKNVEVKGNLILCEEMDIEKIYVQGKKIYAYERESDTLEQYKNDEYGIEFSISNQVKIIEAWKEKDIDYFENNMLLMNIEQSDDYYLKSIESIGKKKIRDVDRSYKITERGTINNAFYLLYEPLSRSENYKYLVIKRDNTVYTILFRNITLDNLVDNVLTTLKLIDGEKISDRNFEIYQNRKLSLKFTYRSGYVGVDDSYNTKKIYSGDAPFKLFIQVNTVTDMSDYSFDQLQAMLKQIARKDGELVKTENMKIISNDAVKFKILTSENKMIYSLYIVVGNNLYDLILTANEDVMDELGDYLFDEIIRSLEI
mgnify:FL=1